MLGLILLWLLGSYVASKRSFRTKDDEFSFVFWFIVIGIPIVLTLFSLIA